MPIKSRPPVHAQGKWGQQLWHRRGSGLFYCHLKTTFKMRLSLPKKEKDKTDRSKEMGPFDSSVEHISGTPRALAWREVQLRVSTSLQDTPVASLSDSFLNTCGIWPSERKR